MDVFIYNSRGCYRVERDDLQLTTKTTTTRHNSTHRKKRFMQQYRTHRCKAEYLKVLGKEKYIIYTHLERKSFGGSNSHEKNQKVIRLQHTTTSSDDCLLWQVIFYLSQQPEKKHFSHIMKETSCSDELLHSNSIPGNLFLTLPRSTLPITSSRRLFLKARWQIHHANQLQLVNGITKTNPRLW